MNNKCWETSKSIYAWNTYITENKIDKCIIDNPTYAIINENGEIKSEVLNTIHKLMNRYRTLLMEFKMWEDAEQILLLYIMTHYRCLIFILDEKYGHLYNTLKHYFKKEMDKVLKLKNDTFNEELIDIAVKCDIYGNIEKR